MTMCEGVKRIPGWKELEQLPEQWEIYKRLVEGVPEGIAVKDVLVGNHWSIVEAESGCGMAMNVSGGRGTYGLYPNALHMELRDLAAQCVSWNFLEASVGVAALNAWYSTPEHAAAAGMKIEEKGSNDGFELYRRLCAGKKVTVVGHFPLIERLAPECDLTILERNPSGDDVPDPGCEYIIPHQDLAASSWGRASFRRLCSTSMASTAWRARSSPTPSVRKPPSCTPLRRAFSSTASRRCASSVLAGSMR